ncbi:hypothetical protein FSP39_019587 [Pinctada imbricata]|uniref:Uncharacterized protein n=1 Tax=Pinctada imbricata TaxID=66713 RepID=A0AA89CBA1_PINIB|nr:hypothetical protein FSP39_019587 [Pinctada imbricata]
MRWIIVCCAVITSCLGAAIEDDINIYDVFDLDIQRKNPCGGKVTLYKDEGLKKLSTNGEINQQECRITFALTPTMKCNQVCVNVLQFEKPMSGNVVQVTASKDGTGGKALVEGNQHCVDGLMATVVITQSAAYYKDVKEGKEGTYKLNFTAGAKCPGVPESIVKEGSKDSEDMDTRGKLDAARMGEYIKGIVTGVCLAIVWLIVLLITWCYYKNSAHRGSRDYPAPKSGPSLAGFKAKLHINKEGKEKDPPKAEYRAKTSSPEHKPLLAGAAGTAAADIALHEVDDDHKVPEVVVSHDSSDKCSSGGGGGGGGDDGGNSGGGGGCSDD